MSNEIKGNEKRARSLVKAYAGNGTSEQVNAVVAHMVKTGDCVWHACAVVTGSKCSCYECSPGTS